MKNNRKQSNIFFSLSRKTNDLDMHIKMLLQCITIIFFYSQNSSYKIVYYI